MLGAGLIDRKSAMEISWGIWTLCLLCSSAQEMNQFEPAWAMGPLHNLVKDDLPWHAPDMNRSQGMKIRLMGILAGFPGVFYIIIIFRSHIA